MKQFILILTILFCTVGCGCLKRQQTDVNLGSGMKAETLMYNVRQLDSLCVADTLANDLNYWLKSAYVDYETNNQTIKYTYVKHPNTKNEMTYILVPVDTLYQITKRSIVE